MGGALAVVAPPLGAFARLIGAFTRARRVGRVVIAGAPLVHAGQSNITHQRRFCEVSTQTLKTSKFYKFQLLIICFVFNNLS